MNYWLQFLLVIASVAFADMCWTLYFIKTNEKKGIAAGFWSVMIIIAGSYTTVSYVEDKSFIAAAAIGAFLGTWLTIEWKKRKNE